MCNCEEKYFGKVSELEWYLSIKGMERYKQQVPMPEEKEMPEEIVKFPMFRKFWKSICIPEYDASTGDYIVYSPLELKLCLPPGGDFEIPLGFYPLGKGFEAYQNFKIKTFIYSLRKIVDPTEPMGYGLSVCNLTENPTILRLSIGEEIVRGCFVRPSVEKNSKKKKLCIIEDVPNLDIYPRFRFACPNIFPTNEPGHEWERRIYISIENTGSEIVFHVQYMQRQAPHLLKDPVLDTIHYYDTEKYSILNLSKNTPPAVHFHDVYRRATIGDVAIPKKRYMVPIREREWKPFQII